jgi:hypothetical protein
MHAAAGTKMIAHLSSSQSGSDAARAQEKVLGFVGSCQAYSAVVPAYTAMSRMGIVSGGKEARDSPSNNDVPVVPKFYNSDVQDMSFV